MLRLAKFQFHDEARAGLRLPREERGQRHERTRHLTAVV
jgi:hypothetical protein